MKQIIFTLMYLVALPLIAQPAVKWSGDTLKVHYQLENLSIHNSLEEGVYNISLNGFAPTLDSNKPKLLHTSETFHIREGYQVGEIDIKVIKCDTINIKVAPSNFDEMYKLTDDLKPAIYENITPYSGIWPEKVLSQGKTQVYRGESIGRMHIYPAAYDYENQNLYYTREFEARIIFTPASTQLTSSQGCADKISNTNILPLLTLTDPSMIIGDSMDKNYVGDVATQGITLPVLPPSTYSVSPGYLIVTSPSLEKAAETFAKWKSSIGYDMYIEALDNIEDMDPDDIWCTIRDYYQNKGIKYVLLLGDGNLIQPYAGSYVLNNPEKNSYYYTDYFYSCLDDPDDDFPDVYLGRIPAANITQANNAIFKIINHEKTPPASDYYYQNTTLYSEFYPGNNYSTSATKYLEDGGFFIETCYQIWNGLNNKTFSDHKYYVHDFYQTSSINTPRYYNGLRTMPSYLKNYSWLRSPDNFIEEWNKGNYLIGVHGHGNVSAWIHDGYVENHISNLSISNNLPILFAFTCYSGSFYHPNHIPEKTALCVQLLNRNNGGIVSCIGANGYTYSPYSNYYFAGLYDGLYPECIPEFKVGSNYPFRQVGLKAEYQLGKLMQHARYRMATAFEDNTTYYEYYGAMRELYHILGDPSINIPHGKPISMKPQFVKTSNGYTLNDPRKLILKNKYGYHSYYFENNHKLTLSELKDYAKDFDLCLVGDVDLKSYIPEFISLEQLNQLSSGGSIEKVEVASDSATILIESEMPDLNINVYDVYGNKIDSDSAFDNKAQVMLTKGINIITVENQGSVLDSKRIINN